MFQGRPLTKYFDFSALCPKSFGNYWESIWSPMQTVHIEALRQLYEHSFSTRVATTQTRFYLGQLTQMRVDGVRWSHTFINHCFYGIFDTFFSKISGIFTVNDPNIQKVLGWVHKFGPIVPNKTIFFLFSFFWGGTSLNFFSIKWHLWKVYSATPKKTIE